MPSRRLRVWLDELHVADIEQRDGSLRLRYTDEALERWPGNTPLISCSLPLGRRALDVEAFCRGLLPEGSALDALAARADVAASDTFALLARYGRDIAGALILSEDEPRADRYAVEPYDTDGLAREVADLETHPLGVHDDSELSIAGLQDKLLLVRLAEGGWGRPLHGRPSTHILKVDSASRPGLVQAEADCLALAQAVGLSHIDPELMRIGARQCLIVERFDRVEVGGRVRRVHQEDLCQATGRQAKYQSRGRGGPALADLAALLDRYAADAEDQLEQLLRIATYNLAIGNGDAHGKNLALVHDSPSTVRLAPLYDTVPTIMWPSLRTDAAMALDGRYSLITCDRLDLVAEARGWPLARRRAGLVTTETLERIEQALRDGVIRPRSPLAVTIRARVRNLLAGSPAGEPRMPFAEDRRASGVSRPPAGGARSARSAR